MTNSTEKLEENEIQRKYDHITDEDKLIFEHLFERHRNLLIFGDTLNTKFSQMIALNGLILSFILIKSPEVKNIYIFMCGIIFILITIIIGIYGYRTIEWFTGAKENFFEDYDTLKPGEGIKKLKSRLLIDITKNTAIQNNKANIFNIMLYFNIIGLVTVVIGYYV